MLQSDISHNMARFYGSWVQNQKYNMLLEYVGGGTLIEFFRRTKPPQTSEDRIKFWENLLDLVKPLSRIHELPISDKKEECHQG